MLMWSPWTNRRRRWRSWEGKSAWRKRRCRRWVISPFARTPRATLLRYGKGTPAQSDCGAWIVGRVSGGAFFQERIETIAMTRQCSEMSLHDVTGPNADALHPGPLPVGRREGDSTSPRPEPFPVAWGEGQNRAEARPFVIARTFN